MATQSLFEGYDHADSFCEITDRKDDPEIAKLFLKRLGQRNLRTLARRKKGAEDELYNLGITFTVYSGEKTIDRILPFDIVPRIISGREWDRLSKGIEQRVRALNAFLYDIYHNQEIIKAGRIPAELIANNDAFLPEMIGVTPPRRRLYPHCRHGHYAHR